MSLNGPLVCVGQGPARFVRIGHRVEPITYFGACPITAHPRASA